MRLRHYLRGLGLGIIVSTLVIAAGGKGNAAELTDEEIKLKARALGMVEEDELLLSEAKNLAKEAAEKDDREKAAMSPVSENAVSGQSVSAPEAETSVSGDISLPDSGVSDNLTDEEYITGSLKGAGAELAINGETAEKEKDENTGSSDTIKTAENKTQSATTQNTAKNTANTAKTTANTAQTTVAGSEQTLSDAGKASGRAGNTGTTRNTGTTGNTGTTETKPAETKPAETKPVETKPAETKPAETKPAENPPASSGQDTTGAAVTINIVKGESSTAVAKKLQQAGLVADAAQFDSYLCLNGYDRRLVTGGHLIPAGASARDVAELITSKGT